MQQRYISKELTHFVGRALRSEEEQYLLLVKILEEGTLRGKRTPGKGLAVLSEINPDEHFATGNMIQTWGVCFCDIPSSDLGIHMRKYSRFGLPFLKSFLVPRGANPVFYIATDSETVEQGLRTSRGDYFHRMIRSFLEQECTELIMLDSSGDSELADHSSAFLDFVYHEMLDFLKPFDSTKSDSDEENYYMEREWRILRKVAFELDDIERIILPRSFAKRLREDFPSYHGQLTFAEDCDVDDRSIR